jgi:hypothetical protein
LSQSYCRAPENMKKIVFLFIVVGLVAGATWAIRTLPWWALVLIFGALVVVAKLTFKKLLKALILIPFKAKGAVLRGATAQIHSVTPSAAPTKTDDSVETEKDSGPQRYFTLDVTIQPKEATGNFSCWELGELRLTRPDFHIDPNSDESSEDDSCTISELQYEEDGIFKRDEGFKFAGPKRLKMTLGVREGIDRLKFQYYFEEFGTVPLPAASLQAAA